MNQNTNNKTVTHAERYRRAYFYPVRKSRLHFTTYNNQLGLIVFLVVVASFIFGMSLELSRNVVVVILVFGMVIGAGMLLKLAWARTPQQNRGKLGNLALKHQIQSEIKTELGPHKIQVDCLGGTATVRGVIPYSDLRHAVMEIAQYHGAHQVIDELTVAADTGTCQEAARDQGFVAL